MQRALGYVDTHAHVHLTLEKMQADFAALQSAERGLGGEAYRLEAVVNVFCEPEELREEVRAARRHFWDFF